MQPYNVFYLKLHSLARILFFYYILSKKKRKQKQPNKKNQKQNKTWIIHDWMSRMWAFKLLCVNGRRTFFMPPTVKSIDHINCVFKKIRLSVGCINRCYTLVVATNYFWSFVVVLKNNRKYIIDRFLFTFFVVIYVGLQLPALLA